MEPTLKDLDKKVDKILLALSGDDGLGIRGINHKITETQNQVDNHDGRITKLEDYNKRYNVDDHEKRLSSIEAENRKFKWKSFVKGVGIGAGSASSAFALGSTKAGAALVKAVTAIGAIIFVCYLVMLIL